MGTLEGVMLYNLTLTNWDKFNPKRDQKSYTWARVDMNIFMDPRVYDMPPEAKIVWVQVILDCTSHNGQLTLVDSSHYAYKLRIPEKKVMEAIEIITARQLATAHDRPLLFTTPTNERTDEQTVNDRRTVAPKFDYISLYWDYPRHIKKGEFLKRCKTNIKTQKQFDDFKKALDNYKQHLANTNTEPQFIKHPTTFLSEWKDWLDPENGKVVSLKGSQKVSDWDLSEYE